MSDRNTYRVWCSDCKRFHDPDGYDRSGVYLASCNCKGVIEQSTGLRDRNGRLIFEGDIISATMTERCGTGEKWYYEVRWVEYACGFKLFYDRHDKTVHENAAYCIPEFEYVGNIHEGTNK
jgi:uncharacterized phage protein (TIGR01671 family)